jgi:hypothetical protein
VLERAPKSHSSQNKHKCTFGGTMSALTAQQLNKWLTLQRDADVFYLYASVSEGKKKARKNNTSSFYSKAREYFFPMRG